MSVEEDLADLLARRFYALLPKATAAAAAVAEAGGRVGRAVGDIFRSFPAPFRLDEGLASADWMRADLERRKRGENGLVDESKERVGLDSRGENRFGRPQGTVNLSSTYDSRTNEVESSLIARGDLWRAEASYGNSSSRNDSSPLFLLQLGPLLFVRDTTVLFPVHLSKRHLIWYGFAQKNGMHSVCPAYWSIQRKWLLMSMIHLNPFGCSFMDIQCPNGQIRYVAGEGITTRAFLPVFGGLLQAQGKFPGAKRFSFSFKNGLGTRVIPTVEWPDKSLSFDIVQTISWKRSGLILQPALQFSIRPTFRGNNPELCTELIYAHNENLGVVCGYSHTSHPSAFTSVSIGRSKLNGNVVSSGVVVRVEAPICNFGRPWFSIQMNSGLEF